MARKPGLRIDVRVDVLMDERYEALGDIAGYNRHEALGRMFSVWAWCLDKQEFVLHEAIVRRFLGPRGVEAILGEVAPGEIVDSLALGERRDGGIYVRGSESLAWLGERRAAAAKGGVERAHGVRDGGGRFVSEQTEHPPKRHPNSSQPTTQTPSNVQPSDSDLLFDPDPEEREKSARPPAASALVLVPPAPRRKRTPKPVACTDAERASVEIILAKLSEQSGVTWTFCDTHAKLILARLRDGISEWDLRLVIGYCASPKASGGQGWRDDEKMAVYLRPATLFGPEKIHDYLPQARAWYERYVDDKRKGAS